MDGGAQTPDPVARPPEWNWIVSLYSVTGTWQCNSPIRLVLRGPGRFRADGLLTASRRSGLRRQ